MRLAFLLTLIGLAAGPLASQERAAGKLGVLELGRWSCAAPGIASAEARFLRTERDFETLRGSRYRVGEETGTYLRLGDRVRLSDGPFEGRAYRVVSEKQLRETIDGEDTEIRCLHIPR